MEASAWHARGYAAAPLRDNVIGVTSSPLKERSSLKDQLPHENLPLVENIDQYVVGNTYFSCACFCTS